MQPVAAAGATAFVSSTEGGAERRKSKVKETKVRERRGEGEGMVLGSCGTCRAMAEKGDDSIRAAERVDAKIWWHNTKAEINQWDPLREEGEDNWTERWSSPPATPRDGKKEQFTTTTIKEGIQRLLKKIKKLHKYNLKKVTFLFLKNNQVFPFLEFLKSFKEKGPQRLLKIVQFIVKINSFF